MQFALDVHRLSSDVSARVVGTFLNEAREWDPNLETPEELSKVDRRVQPKRCTFCGTGNPPKTCLCGKAFYCRKESQRKAWKRHEKICAIQGSVEVASCLSNLVSYSISCTALSYIRSNLKFVLSSQGAVHSYHSYFYFWNSLFILLLESFRFPKLDLIFARTSAAIISSTA